MAIKTIYKYPHINLRQQCIPVTDPLSDEIQTLITNLVDTMYNEPGAVGLSAPQIGSDKRVVVIDMAAKTTKDQLKVMINPEIVTVSRKKMVREGCLSFPEYLVNIKRGTKATVKYLDKKGQPQEISVRDLESVAVQHEIDHLDGILMIDQVHSLKTDIIRRATLDIKRPKTNA